MGFLRLRDYSTLDRGALFLLAIVIAGLAAGQAYLVSRHGIDTEYGRQLFGAGSFTRLADNLIHKQSYTDADGSYQLARMPVYTALVVLSKLIAGNYWSYLLLAFQGAIALVTGLMINRLARRLTAVAWVPALVVAAYALHTGLQLEHLALRETGVFEFLIVAFFSVAATPAMTRRELILMTLICIAAYHTRATGLLLVGALGLRLLFAAEMPAKRRAVALATTIGAVVLAAVPWQTFQSRVEGRLALTATNIGGLNLYKGSSLAFENLSPYIDHDAGDPITRATSALRSPKMPSGDQYLGQLARADIAADPMRYLRKSALRVLAYLSPLETPLGSAELHAADDGRLQLNDYRGNFVAASDSWWLLLPQLSFFVVLFAIPLGLLGLVRHIASSGPLRPAALACLGFLFANIGAHALITAETRYRLYLDPLFLVWAGAALGQIFPPRANARSTPGQRV